MGRKSQRGGGGSSQKFGGPWTTTKLNLVAEYLSRYTTALKKTPFKKAYIDAFAGEGYRTAREGGAGSGSQNLLFQDLAKPDAQALLEGSAVRALKTEPPFDRYVFIERNPARCKRLEALKSKFPLLTAAIEIKQGEANEEIRALCAKNWKLHRAVLFLDPFGMQVEWKTIEAVAGTKAIDLWVLFPLGIGVNRLLKKSGGIPESWRQRLNLLLGSEDWYEQFYRIENTTDLFGKPEDLVVKASMDTIGRYFVRQLKSVFAGVADNPKVLRNSANCPLYLLCFAVGNPNGAKPALRIANYLLNKVAE